MLQLVSAFFIALFVAGVALQVLTYRRERTVKPRRIAITQGAALAAMIVFSAVTQRPPSPAWWLALLGIGVVGGTFYGRLVSVRSGAQGITMSYTLPWLLTWAALMVITQATAVFAQSVPVLIYSMAIVNLGLNIGMNGRILGVYRGLTAGPATALLAVILGLGISVAGPVLPLLAQPDPSEVPPELAPAIVESTGTVDLTWVLDGDSWWFHNADGVGAYVHLEYRVIGIPVSWILSDGSLYETEINRVVNIYWFATEADSEAAFTAWSSASYAEPAPWDLGFGLPTTRLNIEAANHYSDFLVRKGATLVHWKGNLSEEYGSDSPEKIIGIGHLAAIVGAVPSVDVDALRTSWFGRSGPSADAEVADATEGVVPPAGAPTTDVGTDGTGSGEDRPGSAALPQSPAGADEPLPEGQAAAATALAGIILAGGSLVQLGDRLDIESIRVGLDTLRGSQPVDPLAAVPRSEDGRVFVEMPWDEGGPAWVSEEDARHAFDMQNRGYSWDRRWGWVQGGEAAVRQANADRGREAWLARDQVADGIVADIMASREDLARKLAQMQRAEKLEEIELLETQAMIDNWRARVADNRYYWWSGVSIAAEAGFGMATGGLSAIKPVGQVALRMGLHMTTGYAQSWTDAQLAGGTWDSDAFARGSVLGLVKAGVDFGVEATLKTARAVMPVARAAWSGLRGTGDAAEHLGRARELLAEAVHGAEQVAAREGLEAGLAAADREAALELLREGRRLRDAGTSLAELEARGEVTATQARLIRQVWTETFDESAEAGAKEVFEVFEQKYGSGLREVLLGDQGSSATRFAVGSLKTDADRTVLPVFDRGLLERIAADTGEPLGVVNQRLTREVTDMWSDATARNLNTRGLDPADFDAGAYSGFGRSAGCDDAYDANWVMQRQGGGTTMVVRPGDAATYRAAGDTIVDQAKFNEWLANAGDEILGAPRVGRDSAVGFLRDQADAVAAAGDAKTAAKSFARQAWAAGRRDVVEELTGTVPNAELRTLADAIVRNPQDQAELLASAGHTQTSFLEAIQAESERLLDAVNNVE